MAKGLQQHREHQQKLSLLGKHLARRAKSHCELCQASGVPLSCVEAIVGPEPDLDTCLFLCETCQHQFPPGKKKDENHWRCLNHSIWSEVPIAKAVALVVLSELTYDWASDLQEQAYIDEETESLMQSVIKSQNC